MEVDNDQRTPLFFSFFFSEMSHDLIGYNLGFDLRCLRRLILQKVTGLLCLVFLCQQHRGWHAPSF
jgi:hypothetical protein